MADYNGDIPLDQYTTMHAICPKCNAVLPQQEEIIVPSIVIYMCQHCGLSVLQIALNSRVIFEGFLNFDDMMRRANELQGKIGKILSKKPWWKF